MTHLLSVRPALGFHPSTSRAAAPNGSAAPARSTGADGAACGRTRPLRIFEAAGALLLLAGFGTVAIAESPQPPADEATRPVFHRSGGSPSRGLRPIGAPAAANALPAASAFVARPAAVRAATGATAARGETRANDGALRQTAFMQQADFGLPSDMGGSPPVGGASQFEAPPLAGDDYGSSTTLPPATAPPATTLPPTTAPSTAAPLQGLQPVPSLGGPLAAPPQPRYQPRGPGASPSDLVPLPQPQLPSNWATVDNCNLVSGPSGYRAEFGFCGTTPVVPVGVPTYAAPPVIVPPTVMPVAPMATAPFGCRPLFTLGQENYNVQLGQGIIGQPTAYVPGQNIRNFIRYLSP